MSLLSIILALAAACVVVWAIQKFLPENIVKQVLLWLVIGVTIWWLLNVLGIIGWFEKIRI